MSWFVTGTDTGVGKTHTIVHLLRLLRGSGVACAGFKPICCGDRRDAELLLAAGAEGLTIHDVNPIWLKTPVAPLPASRIEDAKIDIGSIIAGFEALQRRVEAVVVEGVGGWLVPIEREYFVSNLAADLRLPVLVVARNRLGCLNHTALTLRSILEHGLGCAGVVLNELPDADDLATATNAEILREVIAAPILPGLSESSAELPASWQDALGLVSAASMSRRETQV